MTDALKKEYFDLILREPYLSPEPSVDVIRVTTLLQNIFHNRAYGTLFRPCNPFWNDVTSDQFKRAITVLTAGSETPHPTHPTRPALMGKIMGTWKRLRGEGTDHIWHGIGIVIQSMMAEADVTSCWYTSLSKATVSELKQILEFFENLE